MISKFFLTHMLIYCVLATIVVNLHHLDAIRIEINKGEVKPEPIAIAKFINVDGSDNKFGREFSAIIKNDLNISCLFEIIDENKFLESANKLISAGPNMKNWSVINARFLVYGFIKDGILNYRLFDVVTNRKLLDEEININSITFNSHRVREIAHMIADKIYERITNEAGYFNTQIAYVSTAKNVPSKRTTKLMIIDQDSKNSTSLTDGSELVLSPRYSPDGKTIAYIAYEENGKGALGKSAHVYLKTIGKSGRRRLLNDSIMKELIKKNNGYPINMTYAPRFSKDGQSMVLAIIVRGSSAIYRFDMTDNRLVQLTKHNKIDTSPCFSPDGSKIVFTSDRDGKESVFVMNADGSNQHKISRLNGKYSQPNWSPRGDLISFSKQIQGQFFIGVMKPDGSGERLINQGFLVEAPSWASNGRYVVYTSQTGYGQPSQIVFSDLTGRYHRLLKTPGDASSPAWSPTFIN